MVLWIIRFLRKMHFSSKRKKGFEQSAQSLLKEDV